MENSDSLAAQKCVPCKGGVEPLKSDTLQQFASQLKPGWQVVKEHHLEKEFKFRNFKQALEFANTVGQLAELEGHHPDIFISWGLARITIFTRKISGLHENDFVLAAKIDRIPV